jgi:quercetin 2,3-dioxygenase
VPDQPVTETFDLGAPPWRTEDPFLFCVHHRDDYPAGTDAMGPDPALLGGRAIGMDFGGRDGWSMYHGDVIPGFPRHPHRGFETITLARRGFIDHSDSLGATARFGDGDAQWMTAGRGIEHAEMFPLVQREQANPTELFQIWLNLPARSKLVEPHFTMLWSPTIPRGRFVDAGGRVTAVTAVAGALDGLDGPPPSPPPSSWAADPEHGVAVWSVTMEPGAAWTLPAAGSGLSRTLYLFAGDRLRLGATEARAGQGLRLRSDASVELVNGETPAELLLLQGRPIAEPVAHHGPFVMNTREELRQAFADYQRDSFGGWPWGAAGPVHARDQGRFAIHADGTRDAPAEPREAPAAD